MTAIKERPILFSAPMVRAILEGRKTVTRREVKKKAALDCLAAGFEPAFLALPGNSDLCPYGKPGDRLWVRETWAGPLVDEDQMHLVEMNGWDSFRKPQHCQYRASGGTAEFFDYAKDETVCRWTPSIHMPRWACRILLEITAVRVERLQAGEGETAFESRYVAEGINRIHQGDGDYAFHPFKSEPGPGSWTDPFDAWRELWVGINGAESWEANPWVWVVEFKRVTP